MAGLAELERRKRRRLQDAFADLRPAGNADGDHQEKLRNLLLGAAADAGVTGLLPRCTAAAAAAAAAAVPGGNSSSGLQSARALAAAATASIRAVESTSIRAVESTLKGGGRGPGQPHTARGAGRLTASGGTDTAAAATSYGQSHHAAALGSTTRGGWRRCADCSGGAAARAPPPGPMDGGFIPEDDPIQRLSRLHVPLAASSGGGGGSGGGGSGDGGGSGGGGSDGGAGGLRGQVGGIGSAVAPVAGGLGHSGAAAQPYDMHDDVYNDSVDADLEVPSDVELALIAIKADLRSHPTSADLPPLVLRSQLCTVLVDKSTVERQLDEQRRANRVRVFKLPTGVDEFGVLAASDYRQLVWRSADAAAAAAETQYGVQAPPPPPSLTLLLSSGAYGTSQAACGRAAVGSSRWHSAAEAFLSRVVGGCTDFELSRDRLVYLLRTPPQPPQREPRQPTQLLGHSPQGCAAAGRDVIPEETVEEQVSLLLHLGCIARHTDGDADAFVLAVPGAGKLIKWVMSGRREVLAWLGKRQRREAPEEQIHKLRFRTSCLPPQYIVRDLVGRGAVKRLDSTCGPMIRLLGGKKAAVTVP